MHQANSSTSSSEPESAAAPGPRNEPGAGARAATAGSLARAFAWTLLWLALLEAGAQLVIHAPWIRSQPLARPIVDYLERGESIEARLRAARASDEPGATAMIEAGWIDRDRWRALPARPGPGQSRLVALYGNSFTRQIAQELERRDPALGVRMVFGPVAPPSHAYACFLEDREQHAADVVVMGIVLETLPGLRAMTRATQSVMEPSPYTFPRYALAAGELRSVEPSVRRLEDFDRALEDPALWRAYVAQLAAHDAFYAGVAFEAGPLDRFVLSRLLKSAWAIRRQRMVGDPVRAGLARPDTSEEVALVLELSKRFAEAARASGARPLVVLIDTPGTPAAASPFIAERLAAAGVDAIRTASSCAGDDPANFAGDGHLSAPCAERVAGRVRDWIAGDSGHRSAAF